MSKKKSSALLFNPNKGPALGIQGAQPFEELQLQQVRLVPNDESEINSRGQVDLTRKFKFKGIERKLNILPVFAANMFGVGTIPMAEALNAHNMIVALEKYTDPKDVARFLKDHEGRTAVPTAGISDDDAKRIKDIFNRAGKYKPSMIVIDVPNGHMRKVLERVNFYANEYPGTIIAAGNVATGSMTTKIIEAGAHIVKCGIGPGSACTTKLIAGVHRPQAAVARECAIAAHKAGGYIIVDGGVRTAGDVAVALALGGDFVMIGGAFAGHDQSGQPIYIDDKGSKWQEFMGSSSAAYMQRTQAEIKHYRAAEGVVQWLPYKGCILAPGAIIEEVEGGLRSALSYAGARSMKKFAQMAKQAYQGNDGLRLVKAEIGFASKGANPTIVGGLKNPLTEASFRPELIAA